MRPTWPWGLLLAQLLNTCWCTEASTTRDYAGLRDRLLGTKPGHVAITPTGGFGDMAKFARVAFNLYEQRAWQTTTQP